MSEALALVMSARSGLAIVLGFVIAGIISAHILLTKPNVSVSAGWIGLVWFSPFLGGLAYFVLGINRVQRRAKKLRPRAPRTSGSGPERQAFVPDGVQFQPLIHSIAFITGRPIETGNSIRILHDGDEAYPAMLAAIAGARASICLSSYIMRADDIGGRFIEALRAAQARGVRVRVIVDGVGSGAIWSPAYARLRRAQVPVQRFMHSMIPWKMPILNLRIHKKILVVDGTVGFTGGINIADQNHLQSAPADPVQDTHFQISGPVVAQLVEAFAFDWSFVTGERLAGPIWFPKPVPGEAEGHSAARVVTAGPDEDLEKIELAMQEALACARDRIQIMTPYFLPDERLMSVLSLAAMRGVALDVILPERSDNRLVDWALYANLEPLLRNGGRIWRSPGPFRHSKVMVVDGQWCLIGSSNWDTRSLRLNFELCVEVYDGQLARELEALMAGCRGQALTLAELRARSLPRRLRDAATRLLLPYL